MNEEWRAKTDIDCPADNEREMDLKDRDEEKDTAAGVATLRSTLLCDGSGMAPLRIPAHSVSVRMEKGSPLSSPRKEKSASARLPSTPHPRTAYSSSDSDTVLDVSYGPSDWDQELYEVEEEVDTDDDVAQIERARRIRDDGTESDAEVVRKTMRRVEIGSDDSEGEGEGPHSVPKARERSEALLTDTDTGMRPVLWIPRYQSYSYFFTSVVLHCKSQSASQVMPCLLLYTPPSLHPPRF
jgi:hypothetical protein